VWGGDYRLETHRNPVATFLFDTGGAKRKVSKRETPRIFFVLCGGRGGLRALHCAAF